ncbi:acyl-CoA dehydrogenase [Denitratisoma sp. DHT3]|uniref:acyl-CoA dehydrogenase family protein n=1 Tax=Denitratisoma sp. DHT3 TaxID=1981880 RepID=UPI00119860AA|nr:acyl-CoA dehydrogenase [Denitratisoma sp. DHT3]QDX80173.1 acyl-CoA dehydrogenase [Denitratisoma sp. DHT3]
MGMLFDSEQEMLAETARGFFAEHAPVAALRKLRDSQDPLGYQPEVWRQMVDLGWTAIVFPEAHGGLEFGYKGLGAVFEQASRTLAATPLFGTVALGGSALLLGGSDAQKEAWLPRIIGGEALFTLAVDEKPRHDPKAIALSAQASDGGYVLNGEKHYVVDGTIADQLVVVARTSGQPGDADGLTLFLVDAKAAGVERLRRTLVDSRNIASIRFSNVAVPASAVIGAVGQGGALLDSVLDRARILLTAEMLGSAAWMFETTVAYLKERVQFDVPIGSFQALQHRAAQMYIALEMSRSAVLAALTAIDENSPQLPLLASLAKAKVSDTIELISNEAVQMHGGIGMTDELDVGLHLKRARVSQQFFGDASFHRDRYATLRGF